jgi:MFS family permease
LGNILLCNEITIIISVCGWGLLSDVIGRRVIYSLGFILMGASIFAHPLVSIPQLKSIYVLYAVRVVFALGNLILNY